MAEDSSITQKVGKKNKATSLTYSVLLTLMRYEKLHPHIHVNY